MQRATTASLQSENARDPRAFLKGKFCNRHLMGITHRHGPVHGATIPLLRSENARDPRAFLKGTSSVGTWWAHFIDIVLCTVRPSPAPERTRARPACVCGGHIRNWHLVGQLIGTVLCAARPPPRSISKTRAARARFWRAHSKSALGSSPKTRATRARFQSAHSQSALGWDTSSTLPCAPRGS